MAARQRMLAGYKEKVSLCHTMGSQCGHFVNRLKNKVSFYSASVIASFDWRYLLPFEMI